MKKLSKRLQVAGFLFVSLFASQAQAEVMRFTLDTTQSYMTVSGASNGHAFEAQRSGSLNTTFSGQINFDVQAQSLTLTGDNYIIPLEHHTPNYLPLRSNDSAYGLQAKWNDTELWSAVRNATFDIYGPALARSGALFHTNQLTMYAYAATLESEIASPITKALTEDHFSDYARPVNTSAFGYIQTTGNKTTILIPVDFTYILGPSTSLHFVGQIFATSVKEPNADFNSDCKVGDADYSIWRQNFGSTSASHAQGDANYDGVVNMGDYVLFRNQSGQTICGTSGASGSTLGSALLTPSAVARSSAAVGALDPTLKALGSSSKASLSRGR